MKFYGYRNIGINGSATLNECNESLVLNGYDGYDGYDVFFCKWFVC